jgi:hypothetical protein
MIANSNGVQPWANGLMRTHSHTLVPVRQQP